MFVCGIGRLGGRLTSPCFRTGGICRSLSSHVTRIGVDDPRMSRIVIHNGTVYISGQTDTTFDNST